MSEHAELWVVRTGQVPYAYARQAQKALEQARHAGEVPDLLLLLEHPPVYTKGRRSTADELPMGEEWYWMQGIEVAETDRGGRVTYHGPGQLVGYPIVSLTDLADRGASGREAERAARDRGASGREAEHAPRFDVVEYVRRLERVMVAALADWGIEAGPIEGLTGVWTRGARPDETPEIDPSGRLPRPARKIGSIGVHVNRAITTHGFAINVSNDLQPFEWIVPCGIEACRMTSVSRELGSEQDLGEFASTIRDRFGEAYGHRPAEVSPAHLTELVEGTEALAAAMPSPVR